MAQRTWSLFAVLVSMVIAAVANAAERIGVAAGVQNSVTGTVGGSSRTISVGDGMFENEVVETAAASTAQLLFRDETTFTVGPESRVTLDKFVYNPRQRTGEIVLSATRGVFRFVSGSARSSSYRVNTPVAVIGVRGTIIDGYGSPSGAWLFVVQEGSAEFTIPGQGPIVLNAGQYIVVRPDGTFQVGTYEGSILQVPTAGVPFPLFGWWYRFDNLEDIPGVEIRDLNDALEPPPTPDDDPGEGGSSYDFDGFNG